MGEILQRYAVRVQVIEHGVSFTMWLTKGKPPIIAGGPAEADFWSPANSTQCLFYDPREACQRASKIADLVAGTKQGVIEMVTVSTGRARQ